jgi:hypothetical protein
MLELITYFTAARRKCAPGPSAAAPRRPAPPARSTPTSSAASSAPRSWPTRTIEEHKSEAAVKAAGKLRLEGKEYVVVDGDVMHFRFNV